MKKKIFFLTAAKPEGVAEPKKKEFIKKKRKIVSTRNGRLRSVLCGFISKSCETGWPSFEEVMNMETKLKGQGITEMRKIFLVLVLSETFRM